MNRLSAFRNIAVVVACCLASASCSDVTDEDSGNRLPDGTYPMTFTAAVEGLTATRAATADGQWTVNDLIAMKVDGNVKKYTVASIAGDNSATVQAATNETPFYWQNTNITVSAWYPYNGGTKPDAGALIVKADQSNPANYQASDYLEANATVTFADKQLAFTHRTAKVVVKLVAGDGVDLSSDVAVTFVSQIGVENSGTEVTPKTDVTDNSTTYTALLIPQQMQNKKFIKVTVGTGDAERDYYYTPTEDTDAKLEAGKQYSYTITVKKTGLEVAMTGNGVSWGSNTDITGGTPSVIDNYTITITDKNNPRNLVVKDAAGQAIEATADGTYPISVVSPDFSISYDAPSDKQLSLIPTSGLCRMSSRSCESTDNSVTYTCHYTNVLSDVTLELKEYAEIGDFYYSDGSWSPVLKPAISGSPTVIGIVYWVGDITGDNYGLLSSKFPKGTHGLVVSLWNMPDPSNPSSTSMKWTYDGSNLVTDWLGSNSGITCTWNDRPSGFTSIQVENKMQGYANTIALKKYNEYVEASPGDGYGKEGNKRVKPVKGLEAFESAHPAPNSSSGWYWPSVMELKYVCWGQGNGKSTNGKNMLNAQIEKANNNGTQFFRDNNSDAYYYSSTEYDAGTAWSMNFYNGNTFNYSNKGYDDDARHVRPLLAF